MKIFCIGKNYAAHAAEMQSAVPESPVVFMKPPTALLAKGGAFYYPDFSTDIHYEAELVLRINQQAKNVPQNKAWDIISAVTVGIDFTARDIQAQCKAKGHPWELAKSFDGSAAIGQWRPLTKQAGDHFKFHLDIDGRIVQRGDTGNCIFNIPFLIHFISQRFTFQKGDLLFTGTPEGVGRVEQGNVLKGYLEEREVLYLPIK